MTLTIPDGINDLDTLAAALAYAETGWYVLPVRLDHPDRSKRKSPGSIVGPGWPSLSSRDAKQIAAWFSGTDYGIALHAAIPQHRFDAIEQRQRGLEGRSGCGLCGTSSLQAARRPCCASSSGSGDSRRDAKKSKHGGDAKRKHKSSHKKDKKRKRARGASSDSGSSSGN